MKCTIFRTVFFCVVFSSVFPELLCYIQTEYVEDVDEATRQFILDQNFETRSLIKNGLNNSAKSVHKKTMQTMLEKLEKLSKGQIDLKNSVQQTMDTHNQTIFISFAKLIDTFTKKINAITEAQTNILGSILEIKTKLNNVTVNYAILLSESINLPIECSQPLPLNVSDMKNTFLS